MTELRIIGLLVSCSIILLVFAYLAARLVGYAWFKSQTDWIKKQKELFFPHDKKGI